MIILSPTEAFSHAKNGTTTAFSDVTSFWFANVTFCPTPFFYEPAAPLNAVYTLETQVNLRVTFGRMGLGRQGGLEVGGWLRGWGCVLRVINWIIKRCLCPEVLHGEGGGLRLYHALVLDTIIKEPRYAEFTCKNKREHSTQIETHKCFPSGLMYKICLRKNETKTK